MRRLAIGLAGLLLLAVLIEPAEAVNCFTWGFEATTGTGGPKGPNGNTVQFNGMYGVSTITSAAARTGAMGMRVPMRAGLGDPGNDSNGTDLEPIVLTGTAPGSACTQAAVGGAGLYSRAWLRISSGFNWNGSSHSTSKVIRWGNAMTMFLGTSGFYVAECDGGQASSGGGICKNHLGITNGGDGCGGDTGNICANFSMNPFSDGQWHEYIVFLKPNSGTGGGPGTSTYNAQVIAYVDGVEVARYENWHLHETNNGNWDLRQQFGVFWYNQVGPPATGTIDVDDVSVDTTFNSIAGAPPTPDTTAPAEPTNPLATAISSSQVNASWTVCTDADNGGGQAGIAHTKVESCTGAGCASWAEVQQVAAPGTAFVHSPLAASTLYRYRMRCQDLSGNVGPYSSIVQATTAAGGSTAPEAFCSGGSVPDARVLFCDNFEDGVSIVSRYYDQSPPGTLVKVAGQGMAGSTAVGSAASTDGGNALKLSFGRTGATGTNAVMFGSGQDYRDLYFRWFMRTAPGWSGSPGEGVLKLARATGLISSNWSQSHISHLWAGDNNVLEIDPANCSGTTSADLTGTNVRCTEYNDFPNLAFLGRLNGSTQVLSSAQADQWRCVEFHARLNDAGSANGINEVWIDSNLEARRADLNLVAGYTGFAINAFSLENFTNSGAPGTRYFDNVAIATTRIGCNLGALGSGAPPSAPSNLSVAGLATPTLSWVDVSTDETSFEIESRPTCGGLTEYTPVGSLAANTNSYQLPSEPIEPVAQFRVRALSGGGPSGYTNEACWGRWKHSTLGAPAAHGTRTAPPPHGSLP